MLRRGVEESKVFLVMKILMLITEKLRSRSQYNSVQAVDVYRESGKILRC